MDRFKDVNYMWHGSVLFALWDKVEKVQVSNFPTAEMRDKYRSKAIAQYLKGQK